VLRPRSASRLTGVDAARGVALLGMGAVHVLTPALAPGAGFTEAVAAGRSAALFAVLAGVGLALAYRRRHGRRWARDGAALVVRAVLICLVGLALGELESGVAVILAYYGVLFVLVVPWLAAGARTLLAGAALVAAAVPLLSFAVRDSLPERDRASPTFDDLAEPGRLLSELLLTGYYPAAAWLAYLLVGLAVGRLALQRTRTAAGVAAAGAALVVLAAAASRLLLGPFGGYDRIGETLRRPPGVSVEELVDAGRFGNVPTTTPWWLATDAPHTTTPLDLLGTAGSALLVLGLLLLVARRVPQLLAPLAAAGSMPLTLYTAHVVVLGTTETDDPVRYYLLQVAVGLLAALVWRRLVGRGPLEAAIAAVAGRVRGART
jgi:uncharacterized membrane protein YeiB